MLLLPCSPGRSGAPRVSRFPGNTTLHPAGPQFLWRAEGPRGRPCRAHTGRLAGFVGAFPVCCFFHSYESTWAWRRVEAAPPAPLQHRREHGVAKHPRSQAGNIASPGRGSPGCRPSNPTAPEPRESAVSASPGLLGDRQGGTRGPPSGTAARTLSRPSGCGLVNPAVTGSRVPSPPPGARGPAGFGAGEEQKAGGRQPELPKHPMHPRSPCTPRTPCTTGAPCYPTYAGHPKAPQNRMDPTHSKHSMYPGHSTHPTCPGCTPCTPWSPCTPCTPPCTSVPQVPPVLLAARAPHPHPTVPFWVGFGSDSSWWAGLTESVWN